MKHCVPVFQLYNSTLLRSCPLVPPIRRCQEDSEVDSEDLSVVVVGLGVPPAGCELNVTGS